LSWLRIEGKMPQHLKVAPLSDAAFRLHVTAMAWCVEHRTDGRIPADTAPTFTRAPTGKSFQKIIAELVRSGLWHQQENGDFLIHDFLKWNISAADYAARAKAGSAGGKRSGQVRATKQPESKPEASAQPPADPKTKQVLPVCLGENEAPPQADSESESESINPPTPFDGKGLRGLGFGSQHREDVKRVRDAWRIRFGIPSHRFRDPVDQDAEAVATAIDSYGEPACLLVLEFCQDDGMVSGREDERRMKHESMGYIFGNNNAFTRMLRHAEKRKGQAAESPEQKINRLKGRGAA
jgi:hypothetical protein